MKEILSVNNIFAAYYKKEVLNGVNISIGENEIVSLIGPNGAGKSTLLKVIAGFLKPGKGRVIFQGNDITYEETYERIRKGLGYFIQGGEIFKSMTVEENLEMATIRGKNQKDIDKKQITKENIYALFPNLKEKQKVIGGLLSGGEKQALALGIVLLNKPKILLLDEPSAGLAPGLVKEVLNKIVTINNKMQISILVVEQNVREVLSISHRAYIMKLGTIYYEGNPNSLLKGSILEDAFLG